MATTKKDLEKKIADLQAVLSAVQDEREGLQARLTQARADHAILVQRLDKANDEISDEQDKVAQAQADLDDEINEATANLMDELEQLRADKARLLSICGMTETEFDLSSGNVTSVLGWT